MEWSIGSDSDYITLLYYALLRLVREWDLGRSGMVSEQAGDGYIWSL